MNHGVAATLKTYFLYFHFSTTPLDMFLFFSTNKETERAREWRGVFFFNDYDGDSQLVSLVVLTHALPSYNLS